MDSLVIQAEALQNILIAQATGGHENDGEYRLLRSKLLSDPTLAKLTPRFVHSCRTIDQFWHFIKYEYPSYAERRDFIWKAFRPLLDHLENGSCPADESVSGLLAQFDPEHVHSVWTKALERRDSDPEGAITTARTLLETVCKHVLDDMSVDYDEAADLPKLYKLTAESLSLAPSQHTEQVFKQVLGGCTAVVEGLGSLRNRLSDAHGKGRTPAKPAPRHAELAVNLAGTMASFVIATWQARQTDEA